MNFLSRALNWKKHPEAVFIFVIPLAIVGFRSLTIVAVHELFDGGQWWHLATAAIGYCTLAAFAYQFHRMFKTIEKLGERK